MSFTPRTGTRWITCFFVNSILSIELKSVSSRMTSREVHPQGSPSNSIIAGHTTENSVTGLDLVYTGEV